MTTPNFMRKQRNIDIVFCIDGTGSMVHCISSVKANAIKFRFDFIKKMTDLNSDIDSLRVKVIVFRDYKDDGDQAMQQSRFFELPADEDEYQDYLESVSASGGGDNPENGLEALYYGMRSDFTTGPNDRQIVVLFTDDNALDLKSRQGEPGYPADMVNEDGLIKTWMISGQDSTLKLRERSKRLIIFAPANTKYEDLSKKLNRCIFQSVEMSKGLAELDFGDILKIIAASASTV